MRLRWSSDARYDLLELKHYIAAENPGAAADAVRRIHHTARRLVDYPHSGAPDAILGLRGTAVPSTQYRIVYRVEGSVVLIIAVRHGAREWPPAEH